LDDVTADDVAAVALRFRDDDDDDDDDEPCCCRFASDAILLCLLLPAVKNVVSLTVVFSSIDGIMDFHFQYRGDPARHGQIRNRGQGLGNRITAAS
jgi:hypothetical protein